MIVRIVKIMIVATVKIKAVISILILGSGKGELGVFLSVVWASLCYSLAVLLLLAVSYQKGARMPGSESTCRNQCGDRHTVD